MKDQNPTITFEIDGYKEMSVEYDEQTLLSFAGGSDAELRQVGKIGYLTLVPYVDICSLRYR